jgi:Chromate resistance exported protein
VTPFDMRGVELSHHGGDCSFETMLRRFDLDDQVLWTVARIVHEADLADDRFDASEAAGLDVICRRLSMVLDDPEVLTVSKAVFDGLYEHRRRALLLGGTRRERVSDRHPADVRGSGASGVRLRVRRRAAGHQLGDRDVLEDEVSRVRLARARGEDTAGRTAGVDDVLLRGAGQGVGAGPGQRLGVLHGPGRRPGAGAGRASG